MPEPVTLVGPAVETVFSDRSQAVIVANGDCDVGQLRRLLETLPRAMTLVLAVDGGLGHCREAGLVPDLFVGDADSADADAMDTLAALAVPQWRYPVAKSASDLQLALEQVATLDVERVWLLGVSGGRTDHLLFNWQLPALQEWPFELNLCDASTEAVVVSAARPLQRQVPEGCTFSVLALLEASGLCIEGARYPLHDVTLAPGQTLGLSNVSAAATVLVSIGSGVVLVLFSTGDKA